MEPAWLAEGELWDPAAMLPMQPKACELVCGRADRMVLLIGHHHREQALIPVRWDLLPRNVWQDAHGFLAHFYPARELGAEVIEPSTAVMNVEEVAGREALRILSGSTHISQALTAKGS